MVATHRYLVADLVTDRPLGTISATGVSYSRRIMAPGDFNGGLPVTSRSVGELVRLMTQRPVALYAIRKSKQQQAIWWGGIIWTTTPKRDARGVTTASLMGATFDSMTRSRYIWDTIAAADVDRGQLLADLWDHMQSRSGNSDLRVETTPVLLGGDPYTTGWDGAASVTYGDAMNDVASMEPPFEWTIDVYADPDGTRHRVYRQGTPLLGNPANRHLVCSPKNLLGFEWVGENVKNATHGLARGAAVNKTVGGEVVPLTSGIAVNQTAVADGAPRVDMVVDYPDETDESKLPGHAQTLVARGAPKPTVTVALDATSPLSPGVLGDYGRVLIRDPSFDGGKLDTTARMIGMSVTPAERGTPEKVTFEFQADQGVVSAA